MEFYPQVDPETGAFKSSRVRTWIEALVGQRTEAALEDFNGNGIEVVSGSVTLDATGEPIREFFTSGLTTFLVNGTTVSIEPDTAVVWRRAGSSWGYQQVVEGWTTPSPTPDTTAPTAGTLASSEVSDTSFQLTVTGANDDRALDPSPYRFSTNGGTAWSAWQSSASFLATGLTPETAYQCRAEVRDQAGNTAQTGQVSVTTTATPQVPLGTYRDEVLASSPVHYLPMDDAPGSTAARNLGSDGTAWSVVHKVPANPSLSFGGADLGDGDTSMSITGGSNGGGLVLSEDFFAGLTSWSAEIIIRPTGGQAAGVNVFGSGRLGFRIGGNPTSLYVYMNDGFGSALAAWGEAARHVAVTYDGAILRAYLNGVQVHERAVTGPVNQGNDGGTTNVGWIASPSQENMIGTYAGAAVYDRVLAANEIARHAQAAGLA